MAYYFIAGQPVALEVSAWWADQKGLDNLLLEGVVVRRTAKAVLLDPCSLGEPTWIPLSQILAVGIPEARVTAIVPPADPYMLFGLTGQPTLAELTRAYRERMLLVHPDANPAARIDPEIAARLHALSVQTNDAYERLRQCLTPVENSTEDS